MISTMAVSTGDELIYDSNTPGGYRFMDHASSSTTLDKINANNWDYVVLQAQSQETSLSQAQMQTEVYPYAESLSNAIRANYACSQPMFYMTWGRETEMHPSVPPCRGCALTWGWIVPSGRRIFTWQIRTMQKFRPQVQFGEN